MSHAVVPRSCCAPFVCRRVWGRRFGLTCTDFASPTSPLANPRVSAGFLCSKSKFGPSTPDRKSGSANKLKRNGKASKTHAFETKELTQPTWCDVCDAVIWGLFKQCVVCTSEFLAPAFSRARFRFSGSTPMFGHGSSSQFPLPPP